MAAAASVAGRNRPPMRLRRRLLFVGLALAFVLLLTELGGAVCWWGMTGGGFTFSRAQAARQQVALLAGAGASADGEQTAEREQSAMRAVANAGIVVHPYLGFVNSTDIEQIGGFPISEYGFVDTAPPIYAQSDDRYVVALVGGSVALQLGCYADDVLAKELRKSAKLRGKKIQFVRMAVGGWKQPQQIFALQLAWLRGAHFDLVLNLDGFNEVAMPAENVSRGVPGWFPRSWAQLMDRTPSRAQMLLLGRLAVAREQRQLAVASAGSVWWSPTLQCLWLLRDRRMASDVVTLQREIDGAEGERTFAATGPGIEGRDLKASRVEMVAVWQRASRELHALCREHGADYHHFLQPNQYVAGSKPIGSEERAVAIFTGEQSLQPAVVHGYPLLRRAGAELKRAGVPFSDLTMVFADHPEPLYIDTCCHVGRRGSEIMAIAMVARVRARLDLGGFVAERLRVFPDPLRVVQPGRGAALHVLAFDAAGTQIEVSSSGLGTRFSVDPADLAAVAEDGSVFAQRRGRGRISVTFGQRTESVAVVAQWPDDLVIADGMHQDGGDLPQLRAVAEAGSLQLSCSSLPEAGFRLLAAASRPLPATVRPGQEGFGVAPVLLAADGSTVVAACPVEPLAGVPLFLRVYVVDQQGAIRAASNTLVVTRG